MDTPFDFDYTPIEVSAPEVWEANDAQEQILAGVLGSDVARKFDGPGNQEQVRRQVGDKSEEVVDKPL